MKGVFSGKGLVIALLSLIFCFSEGWAKGVETTSVRFAQRRLAGVVYPWWESEVSLRAVGAVPAENVRVSLTVAFRRPDKTFYFTKSATVAVVDRTIRVRYYIPGDIINAYQLGMTPDEYLVEVSSANGAEEFDRANASAALSTLAKRNDFKAASRNAGMLLNHYQTPFYALPETWRDLPAYVIP